MKKVLILVLVIIIGICEVSSQQISYKPTLVQKAVYFDETPPLRDMPIVLPGERDRSWKDGVIENKSLKQEIREIAKNSPYNQKDGALQTEYGTRSVTGPVFNFDGVGNVNSVYPPDTEGDVGPNHYFQMINLSFAIWDKQGNKIYGPVDNSTLWDGFIGPWTGTNDGDPILLYDELADRWVATQFAINTSNGTYWELIAVSQTPDPLDEWYRYAFQFYAFPDYPKVAVWSDAYYASFNMFGSYNRVGVAAFERDEMLVGNPNARMVYFDQPSGTFSMLPSDVDGTPPPAGAPNYFSYLRGSTHELEIYEFSVDWNNTNNSSFTLVNTLIPAAYSAYLNGIPQPGTTQKLDDLAFFLMYRLQYRNFGSYQTLVTNHTVNHNGIAGIRWYELRKDNTDWYIYQEGTYSPDTEYRWMGSVAMNGNGDIALGYSVSSSSVFPSIRYTGRRVDDPLGQMTIDEIELIAGSSSQTYINRWGDYACMSVDPSDDTTFWFTEEYMKSTKWGTRIASFNLGPIQQPTVDAGVDTMICENQLYPANGIVTSAQSVLWTTSGDGFFQNPNLANTFYLRGNDDITNGQVTLTLTAFGYLPGYEASDSVLVLIQQLPSAYAGPDTLICEGESLLLESAQVAYNDSLLWTTNGDGSFDNDTILIATYTPGPDDINTGSVVLTLTASGINPCEDSSSDQINVTIEDCTGVDELSNEEISLSLIPNPNHGIFDFTIESLDQNDLTLQIFNLHGQVIFTFKIGQLSGVYSNRINMKNYPRGIYFINVQNGKVSQTEKLIIY